MNYVLMQKSELKKIKISDLSSCLPDLKNCPESKSSAIAKWLMHLIDNNDSITPNSLLPAKPDLAYLLGVSIGTVQNALRYIEDMGYIESKQCIGTIVRNRENPNLQLRKLTSKRETAISAIKKYIIDNDLKEGDSIPSTRILAAQIGCSANTARLAIEYLVSVNILVNGDNKKLIKSTNFSKDKMVEESATLVKKVENDLKKYITNNLKTGDRIPAHEDLSKKLSASIKTIHDALKTLIEEGILRARRGRYGTTVLKMPDDKNIELKKETSIFAPAREAAFYYYEKTQNHIKKMIAENYEIGSKLPSINELSKQLNLSPNTIRKAFHNLAKEGYLTFSRGRYGGTFVTDIPDEQAFKWLAVNSGYVTTDSRL